MLKNCFVLTEEEKEFLGLLEIYSPNDYDIKDLPYQCIKETGSFMTLYIYDSLTEKIKDNKDIVVYLRKHPDKFSLDTKMLEEMIFGKDIIVTPIKEEIYVPDYILVQALINNPKLINDKVVKRLFSYSPSRDVFHSDIKSLLRRKRTRKRRLPVRSVPIFFIFFTQVIKKLIKWRDKYP